MTYSAFKAALDAISGVIIENENIGDEYVTFEAVINDGTKECRYSCTALPDEIEPEEKPKTYVSIGFSHDIKYDDIQNNLCDSAYSQQCTNSQKNNVTIVYVSDGTEYSYTIEGSYSLIYVFDNLDSAIDFMSIEYNVNGNNTITLGCENGQSDYIKSVTGDSKIIKYIFGDQKFGEDYSYKEST